EAWSYRYDDLHRLTEALSRTSATDTQTFSYDDTGNLTAQTAAGWSAGGNRGSYIYPAPGPSSVRPHAVTTAAVNTYTYDTNGTMASGAGRTMAWDGLNRPVEVGDTRYAYDGLGARIKRIEGGQTTIYLGDGYEIAPSGVVTKYVNLGKPAIAKRVG